MSKKVALIRGDGTGPELVKTMLSVLRTTGTATEFIECDAGAEWWEQHRGASLVPEETWNILGNVDACFKGPTTTPWTPGSPRSVAVSIRQRFNLYANVRPIKTFKGHVSPLGEVDFVCVREATEGMYSGLEHRLSNDVAIGIRKITRQSSEKVADYAFKEAQRRGWSKVFAINKGNILKESDGLFMEAVHSIASKYPSIKLEETFIDNCSQQLVKNPAIFNQSILLSTNLFMDIISEEASGLIGSIGTVYSANIGDKYAMFEPAHGSAPKYKGLDKVDPVATILSGAWMLGYLGDERSSSAIFEATKSVIEEGKVITYDLGGSAKASEMASAISTRVLKILK
ncbi:MAG: isocitrate/isopropylmalate dehydrogenase family protein [Nitrososphaerota archaeon]|nr:isocitrate/isopropylmalate dehydrogenase family protein [Nitrososphaerota archaeon]